MHPHGRSKRTGTGGAARDTLDTVIARAEQVLPGAIWLDQTVHVSTVRHLDDIDAAERLASEINNGGIAAQLSYLSGIGWAPAELDQLVDRLVALAADGQQPW